ncbi:MAG: phosphotransferase [Pseudonocardiales bacterium]
MAGSSPGGPPPTLTFLLGAACQQAGIDPSDARLLRHFANAVYLVSGTVARVDYSPDAITRSSNAVVVTRWLVELGFPVTAPLDLPSTAEQPIVVHDDGRDIAVTFWRYYAAPEPLPPRDLAALGRLARRLHAISGRPPAALPAYRPLTGLQVLLSTSPSGLDRNIRQWLTDRVGCLLEKAAKLRYPLGVGLIHADLYSGNMIYDSNLPSRPWLLGDWDSVCLGPREIDLVPTATAPRFGLDDAGMTTFADAYGYDIRNWEGVDVLRQIRELSTLPALIRLADTDPESAQELDHRLDSLQRGDITVRWHRQ